MLEKLLKSLKREEARIFTYHILTKKLSIEALVKFTALIIYT